DMVGVIEQVHLVLYADHVGVEGPVDTARCRQQRVKVALGDVLSATARTVAPLSVALPGTFVRPPRVALLLIGEVAAGLNAWFARTLIVPTDWPGINVPPATTTPGTVPVPASMAPGVTSTPLDDEMSPVTASAPPVTTVAPV